MQGLLRAGEAKSALPIFVAAGLAGATASAALYPLDVVRSRLMCDTVRAVGVLTDMDCSSAWHVRGGSWCSFGMGRSCLPCRAKEQVR